MREERGNKSEGIGDRLIKAHRVKRAFAKNYCILERKSFYIIWRFCGQSPISEYLIKKGLAKEYDGGSKVW